MKAMLVIFSPTPIIPEYFEYFCWVNRTDAPLKSDKDRCLGTANILVWPKLFKTVSISRQRTIYLNGVFTLSDTENDKCSSETDETAKIRQWHQLQGLGVVWSALHSTVEPIIIVVGLGLTIILGVVQYEHTIRVCMSV